MPRLRLDRPGRGLLLRGQPGPEPGALRTRHRDLPAPLVDGHARLDGHRHVGGRVGGRGGGHLQAVDGPVAVQRPFVVVVEPQVVRLLLQEVVEAEHHAVLVEHAQVRAEGAGADGDAGLGGHGRTPRSYRGGTPPTRSRSITIRSGSSKGWGKPRYVRGQVALAQHHRGERGAVAELGVDPQAGLADDEQVVVAAHVRSRCAPACWRPRCDRPWRACRRSARPGPGRRSGARPPPPGRPRCR